jgi:hypothetical protein
LLAAFVGKPTSPDEDKPMRRSHVSTPLLLVVWLISGAHVWGYGDESDPSPAVELLIRGTSGGVESAADGAAASSPWHEAMAAPGAVRAPQRSDRPPPPAIVERPGAPPPNPDARWIGGYWTWNEGRMDFDWVTGVWRVAPPGKFWVSGYWRREPTGWSRVPGLWSQGHAAPAAKRDAPAAPPDIVLTRPLPQRPTELIGPPPGPGTFYVPGEYVPQGSQIVWKPGFWYPSQPGWEWTPAHWVRQASGWTYRAGRWNQLNPGPSQPPANGSVPAGSPVVASDGSDKPGVDSGANELPGASGSGENENEALAAEKPTEGASPAPASMRYRLQPTNYNPWGGMQWSGGAPFGGMLSRFLSF